MTKKIDDFLVDHGFDREELTAVTHRPWIYPAIILTGIIAVAFITLALIAWF